MLEIFEPYLVPLCVSALCTLTLVVLALKIFPKIGLMDKPEKYRLTRKPIPYAGGLALYASFMIVSLIFLPLNTQTLGMLIGATVIATTGFLDDIFSLPPLVRLCIQAISALVIVFSGFEISVISNPLGGTINLDIIRISLSPDISLSVLSALFLIVWFVGMINTMNFFDGVPGLASGIAAIAATVLFILAIRPNFHVINQTSFVLLSGSVAVSAFVFWCFDFPPPRLLMGDTGSTFLGFLLALFAVFAGGKIATAFIVMGFPIFDTLLTIIRRIMQKKSPFIGDRQHLHHDLLRAGLSERKTALIIYTLSALFGLTALFLESFQKLIAILVIFAVMVFLKLWLVKIRVNQAA